MKYGKTGSCSFGGMIPVFWGSFRTSFFTFFGGFSPFFTIFHDLSSKTCFLGKSSEVKEGRFFSFLGVFVIIFLKIFSAHVPKGGIFPVISQFWLSSNRFSRFFSRFFPKITEYHGLSISLNSTLFSLNLGQKIGAPGGTRTHDPLLRRQMLYPAELPEHILSAFFSIILRNFRDSVLRRKPG